MSTTSTALGGTEFRTSAPTGAYATADNYGYPEFKKTELSDPPPVYEPKSSDLGNYANPPTYASLGNSNQGYVPGSQQSITNPEKSNMPSSTVPTAPDF